MRATTPTNLIDVEALRIGMFVHLDGGWMSHPFPLSHFKISSDAQLAAIRALGLKQVRWSPQQSDPLESESESDAGAAAPVSAEAAAAATAGSAIGPATTAAAGRAAMPATAAPAADAAALSAATSESEARREQRRRLAAQRAALAVCERQFGEAAKACRQVFDLAPAQPQQARAQAESLTQALQQKMLGQQELCVRLLTEAAGDRASHARD